MHLYDIYLIHAFIYTSIFVSGNFMQVLESRLIFLFFTFRILKVKNQTFKNLLKEKRCIFLVFIFLCFLYLVTIFYKGNINVCDIILANVLGSHKNTFIETGDLNCPTKLEIFIVHQQHSQTCFHMQFIIASNYINIFLLSVLTCHIK